jgi:hypothetical protein
VSKWCRQPQGPLIKVCGVSLDAYCHGGFNEIIGGHVRHQRPEISPPSHGGGPISPHLRHHMRLFTLTPICGGRGVIESCRLLTAAALSSRSDVIRIVFSLPMSSSLVCRISPTAIRKKVARVPQGRGLNIRKPHVSRRSIIGTSELL